MSSKIGAGRFSQVRKYAQTAAKAVDSTSNVKPEPLKQTKLPNGLIVASKENYLPVTKVGVFLRAGSRYETSDNLGITHLLRNSVGLTTKSSTTFGITRNIEYYGGILNATTTRDNFIYLLQNIRDNNLETIKYLIDSITKPEFKSWELEDNLYRMKIDLERYEIDSQAQLADLLHRAAYGGGLSNSLHCKSFNLTKYSANELKQFTKNHFASNSAVVVGLGVDHDQLVNLVQKEIGLGSVTSNESNKSKYVGGDCRQPFNSKLTFATVVTEGAPMKNKKDFLILELVAKILGQGPRINHCNGGGKLASAVSQVAKEPFKVGALNLSYLDTGLFGFTTINDGKETKEIIKLCVETVRKVAKEFNEADLKIGKERLRSDLLSFLDDQSSLLEWIGTEGSLTGKISTVDELEKLMNSITVQDVKNLISKVVKGKPSIAAIGYLDNMPYAEDLV